LRLIIIPMITLKHFRSYRIKHVFVLSFLIVLAVWPLIGVAQPNPQNLSLKSAIEMALGNDNNIMASKALFDASGNDIAKARAEYFPKLALSGSYSHLSLVNEMTLAFPAPIGERKIQVAAENPFNMGLTLSGELFTFGRRPAAVAIARAGNRSDELRYSSTRKNIFDITCRNYFGVVFADQSLSLLKSEADRFDQIANLIEKRYDQGFVSEYEVLQTRFRQANYRSAVIEMTNTLAAARLNLAKLLNMSEDKIPVLGDTLDETLLAVPSATDWESAFTQREDYLDSKNLAAKAESARRLAKSAYFPNISLFTTYSWRNGNQPDLDEVKGGYTLGVNLNWLLFDGFSRRSEIRKDEQIIKAAGLSSEEYRKTIPTQIKSQFLTSQNLASKLEIQNKALVLAQKAMSIAQKRLEIGDLTLMDFLDIENNLAAAELGLLKSRYDFLISRIDLKKAAGYYPELTTQ
jgi:outer membrane protein TolC